MILCRKKPIWNYYEKIFRIIIRQCREIQRQLFTRQGTKSVLFDKSFVM